MSGAAMDSVSAVFRAEYGRAVATLTRLLGDIDSAEEAVQEAFAVATDRWPTDGTPPNPGGWIVTTARNRALDRIRRESTRRHRYEQAYRITDHDPERREVGPVDDDRLRLVFTCCHPALAPAAQVALTLRLLGGLSTDEIARAFMVPEPTMGQRVSRAKAKITAAGIPYRIPRDADRPDRLPPVLAVVYLIFNEGYTATTGQALIRDDLCHEAIRLARLLVELMPDEPEARGLLALLLLTAARRAARLDDRGRLVRLADQDRGRWDRPLIIEGHAIVRDCLRRNSPGPYQWQAAIAAVHADAADATQTDWGQIRALYDQLLAATGSPVVAVNRAVAVMETDGPAAALNLIDELTRSPAAAQLGSYQHFHATRAEVLSRLGRVDEARAAYDRAIALAGNQAEVAFLRAQRDALTGRHLGPASRD